MNKLIYSLIFVLVLHLSFNIDDCKSQWVKISNGIEVDSTCYSFTIVGNVIFAGTSSNGVFLTTNNGINWLQTALNDWNVFSLVSVGDNIFAGKGGNSGVSRSTNSGNNWTQTNLNSNDIRSLISLGTFIFAGTLYEGVYRTTNYGVNWPSYGLSNLTVSSFTTINNKIFAGTNNYGVWLTSDNGEHWSLTGLNGNSILSLTALGNNIFAGTLNSGIYYSPNSGTNWYQTSLDNINVRSLSIFGNNIFAGTDSGIYISTNIGTSWVKKNQGFNIIPTVSALLVTNNYIFAGTYGQSIWRRSISEIIGINKISTEIPSSFSLMQNYPNPFNPTTNIRYEIPKNGFVKLVVYNILGKEIETLVNEKQTAGVYEVSFNGIEYPSGVYYYKISIGNFSETKRMILIK